MPRTPIPRRTFLRASGVSIGLPLLDAMMPPVARGGQSTEGAPPNRIVLVGRALGLHAPYFFPEQAGREYRPSRYLEILESHRKDFTVFSGVSHRYGGGHGTLSGLITGVAPERMRPGDIRNSISLDQEVAERLQTPTRFGNLVLGSSGLSHNRKGVRVPAEGSASRMFRRMFIAGTPAEMARELHRLEAGQSILDGVRAQASSLGRQLGASDRDRIDLLLNSIREAEQQLNQQRAWVFTSKPKVEVEPFDTDYSSTMLIERERQWLDLVHLALQTDSTRVVTLHVHSHAAVSVNGELIGHHEASHHGQNEATIERLATIEEAQIRVLAEFLDKMKMTREGETNLLNQTQVLYASDLGNASAHTTSNLPVLLAGGGFRHAGHVVLDRQNNTPLSNLFVRMLQQLGIEMERFGSSTGVMIEV